MNICLCEMNKELARRYFKHFVVDPMLFLDNQEYKPYTYTAANADERVDRYREMGRIYLAVMLDEEPIGEIVLKNIDRNSKCCTLGISLRSDEYKDKGYGTAAEILALRRAFNSYGMETVYADSVIRNTRSQHVLKKVGFSETHRDSDFVYFRCNKANWNL